MPNQFKMRCRNIEFDLLNFDEKNIKSAKKCNSPTLKCIFLLRLHYKTKK